MAPRKSVAAKRETGARSRKSAVQSELGLWRPISCCESALGKQGPNVSLKLRVASKGRSFGIVFSADHPCGLQNFDLEVTVYDANQNAWTQTISEVFTCGTANNLTLFHQRYLWAIAKIPGNPPAKYMGPLPDRIVAASVEAQVQSCCGKVSKAAERMDIY